MNLPLEAFAPPVPMQEHPAAGHCDMPNPLDSPLVMLLARASRRRRDQQGEHA